MSDLNDLCNLEMAPRSTYSSKKRDVILILCAVLGLTLLVTGLCLIILPHSQDNIPIIYKLKNRCNIQNLTIPILSLIGSSLLFIAFIGQIVSNRNIAKRFNMEKELQSLELLYTHIKETVDNFTFKTFPENSLCEWGEENMEKVQGLAAFDRICRQMTVYANDESDKLMKEPSVKELKSILQLVYDLMSQLKRSIKENNNNEIIHNIIIYTQLANYLFETKISAAECLQNIIEAPIPKNNESGYVEEHSAYCVICGYIHGVPEGIKSEVDKIQSEVKEIKREVAKISKLTKTQEQNLEKND